MLFSLTNPEVAIFMMGIFLTIQGVAEVFRAIICIQTGHWPARICLLYTSPSPRD